MASLPLIIKYLLTGFIGMLPIIELRGAIPIGVLSFKLTYIESFICSFIGNIFINFTDNSSSPSLISRPNTGAINRFNNKRN